ncbi:inactive ubiquitin carboxyl-terminal hydrolase MINDY-4B isoform X2 [Cimex lectularius]|nr:inactive ubiquitin carboxyl-terminal hydrolase MINDY-4B isoform X2 [Cimex lectularius]XP_014240356.1 inactive ubiquitin carboxyl-terminal hydrolase MINDY-4B isoform X2 [Cimex lectularius]XP_014240358.1 inactive ubiquitin carboxyl-terminal hydrolase MINDY-4B isoform X2 [Cimex lectularius]
MDSVLFRANDKNEKAEKDGSVVNKIEMIAKAIATSKRSDSANPNRVLYARQQRSSKAAVVGGDPISEEMALLLRSVVFGTAVAPPRGEWLRTGILVIEDEKEIPYLLKGPKNTTRGLLTVLQAEIIKYILFDNPNIKKGEPAERNLARVTPTQLNEACINAICKILWRVGEKKKAILCLPQDKVYLHQSLDYFQDGITERIHMFEIEDFDDLQIMVKRYSYLFLDDPGPGAMLLLYSCVTTRGPDQVLKDMDNLKSQLIGPEEEGSICLVTLILTGRATPYLHNGVVYVGDEDHYATAQWGILSRSEIGLLVQMDTIDADNESNIPGSRLKTPSLPVWVVSTCGHFGVMFNTNRELLHNYHAERRFDLRYITCGGSQSQLTVDTRQTSGSSMIHSEETNVTPIANIEKLIQTKWPDAHITWHGSTSMI